MSDKFPYRLAELRKKHGLTLEAVAEKCGSSKSYIWDCENKLGRNPSFAFIYKLAMLFGVSAEYMAGAEDIYSEDEVFYREYMRLNKEQRALLYEIMQGVKKWRGVGRE